MALPEVVALVVSSVLILALAFYLIWVVFILRRLVDTLGKVTFGVSAIAHRVAPIGPVVDEVNSNLDAVAGTLESLVADLNTGASSHAS